MTYFLNQQRIAPRLSFPGFARVKLAMRDFLAMRNGAADIAKLDDHLLRDIGLSHDAVHGHDPFARARTRNMPVGW